MFAQIGDANCLLLKAKQSNVSGEYAAWIFRTSKKLAASIEISPNQPLNKWIMLDTQLVKIQFGENP